MHNQDKGEIEMRKSGILLPIFALPSRHGIGGFTAEARTFVDRLAAAGQSCWQILPLGPVGRGNSPYQPVSCFAGETAYIDPEALRSKGLLSAADIAELLPASLNLREGERINYDVVLPAHKALLRRAFGAFRQRLFTGGEKEAYERFCEDNKEWIDDFSLYMSIRDAHCGADWPEWESPLRCRDEAALTQMKQALAADLEFWKWTQYEFFCEWEELAEYAHGRGIEIIGDVPIYAAYESADCWVHPELFQLDEERRPVNVSGAPPDAFTPEGQCWGNPLYDWEHHRSTGYRWWLARLRQNFHLFDVIRLDHMRGFESYYSIPADTQNPLDGHWEKGPDMDFFHQVEREFPASGFIAEDLGFLTEDVFRMIRQTGYPGMKILQFAFDSDESNLYLPDRYDTDHSVVYTGTHDNDTTLGWYRSIADYKQRFVTWYLKKTLGTLTGFRGSEVSAGAPESPGGDIPATGETAEIPLPDVEILDPADALSGMIELALSTRCETCILPMQDWLGLGSEARINLPGTPEGNWGWQMQAGAFDESLAKRIAILTGKYGRKPSSCPGTPSETLCGERTDDEESSPCSERPSADGKEADLRCRRPRALVLGCLSIDICPRFVSRGAKDFSDVIHPGGITRILGNDICPGGSVANTGIAMKLFGVDPVLCGKIGQDDFGTMLKNMLVRGAGQDSLAGIVEDSAAATAYSLILAPEGLDRAILQNPGANDAYMESELELERFPDCRLMHFGHPPTMRHFYENAGWGLVSVFRRARRAGLATSLDLCAVDPDSDAGREDWEMILTNVLPLVDFFVPSIDELRYMLRMPNASPEELAGASRGLGARNVLIKCGAEGMYFENCDDMSDICSRLGFADGAMADWEGARGMRCAEPVEREVSGLGAGDTSIAAYLAAMLRGFPFRKCVDLAAAEGALCVTKPGATEGLRPFEDL